MSRKRESLVDLLHWSRKSSTCDQTAKKEHEDRPSSGAQRDGSSLTSPNQPGRPHTSLGLTGRVAPYALPSSGSSFPGQPANGANCNNRGLPPLARAGSVLYVSSANGSGNSTAPEQSPDPLTHFQEALYVNGQPHNATSRLLRLGAGSPSPTLRRSVTACFGPGTIPPLPTPQQQLRTLSPATGLSPFQANFPANIQANGGTLEDSSVSFLPAAGTPSLDAVGSRQQPLSPRSMARHSTAWTGAGSLSAGSGGSPPRSVQRFGSRENSALVEEARRMAQQAAEVLYGSDTDVTHADREAASEALLQLESLLGPREVALTKLAHEARSLRADVGRELHASDKQSSFARAQLKALERQHDRLRQQLRPRPEPITLPHTGLSPLSDTGTPSISPKPPGLEGIPRTMSGSVSAPQSPSMSRIGPPAVISMLGSGMVPPDSPLRWLHTPPSGPLQPSRAAAQAAGSGSASGSGSEMDPDRERQRGREGEGEARGSANDESGSGIPITMSSVVPGGQEGAEGGLSPLASRWNLAGAMERTLQLRALSRAEAAMQTVAAMRAAEAQPPSEEVGESGPPVDVEELRRLKHTPGALDAEDEQPSYIGLTVRRATSPLVGNDSIAGLTMFGSVGAPGAGFGGGGGGGGDGDPRATLQWSNRGISTSKMPLLREVLQQTPQLTRLGLSGNKLSNEDVMELMAMLSEPGAPRVNDICLDQNTALTWRCALPLALALGMSPDMAAASISSDWAAVAASLPTASPGSVLAPAAVPSARDKVRRLGLRTLSLSGVKLGDKGVAQLAEGLRANHSLRQLDLRRCGISDSGGAVLMEVLESNGQLHRLDVSWNALRSETARALEVALAGNAGLRTLSLAHNGFGDCDGARVIKGLLGHGKWLCVDLSHNTLGPGSCMMVGELLRRLGGVASGLLSKGAYTEGWSRNESFRRRSATGNGVTESGAAGVGTLPPVVGSSKMLIPDPSRRFQTMAEGSPPTSPTSVRIAAGQLGAQLQEGQPMLALDGNPLGSTGLRIILDAMEAMGQDMMAAAELELPDAAVRVEPPEVVPPLPLIVSIAGCNVTPPSDRSSGDDGGDDANPFLPSIAVLCRPGGGADGRGKAGVAGKPPAGKDAKKPAGKGPATGSVAGSGAAAGSGPSPTSRPGSSASAKPKEATKGPSKVVAAHAALTLHSPHLDLHSPAGVYNLDLAHPSTAILVSYLLRMAARLTAAVGAGRVAAGVALQLSNISVNGKVVKVDQLAASLDNWSEGTLQMTVRAPAVLAVESPTPLTPLVALWLASLLSDATTSPLWKLSVIQAAGSVCFFTPWQCLALLAGFDRDTQSTECVAAAQMLYARSAQPLAFWDHVLPRLTHAQQQALRERVGDLVALDMNRPMGRYTLNLSRQVDRFVALRLQLASALECSWLENKYFINWLNASFNGQTLDRPGLTRIRDYTLPGAGVLRLDYVSYQKPGLQRAPATSEELNDLLAALRSCTLAHVNALLQVRALTAPPPPQAPAPSGKRENARSPIGRRKPPPPPPPPPKPRLTAFQLGHMTLAEVAHVLASPPFTPHAPPPVSDAHGHLPPAPSGPSSWVTACGFNPEPLFRRTGVLPPESCLMGALTGPLLSAISDAAAVAELLQPRGTSITAKSVKSMGGRTSVMSSRSVPPSRKGSRRGGKEEEKDEEERDWKTVKAEYHAALLLRVHQAKDLPLLVSKMCPHHLALAVGVLLRQEGGQRVVTALLAALNPLAASKFLYDQVDPSPCLLPAETRRHLIAAMPPERLKLVEVAARGASEAAVLRARRVRTMLNVWASERFVSAEQVTAVMGVLHTEADRVAAMVVLWPRLVDGRWKKTYLGMTLPEQRQIMTRLGHLHVYMCLGDPHGISFALDLTEPEQRDIARELVRMAVKETTRAKQEAKARGGFYAATLLELHGNGNPVSIPEDEKLWGMADSNFKTMDFLYSPTFEQSLQQAEAKATCIQRFWTSFLARRARREVLVAQGSLPLVPAT